MESLCWDGHGGNHGDRRVVQGVKPYVCGLNMDMLLRNKVGMYGCEVEQLMVKTEDTDAETNAKHNKRVEIIWHYF